LISDGVVLLRDWAPEDAGWFATTAAGDELIQRYTTLLAGPERAVTNPTEKR